jgi:hypothetical protein
VNVDDPLTQIAELGAQQVELLQKLVDAQKKESSWLKVINGIGPIMSALLIALVGWYFTSTYNQQQVRLAQIEAIEKLSPKLTEGTTEQRLAALASVLSLDSENLAIRTAGAIAPQDRVNLLSQLFHNSLASQDYDLMGRILKLTPPLGIAPDPSGRTPLQVTVDRGDLLTTDFLINKGFLVNDTGTSDSTVLIDAARSGNSAMVQLLLRHGAQIEATDKDGKTALLVGVERGHVDVVKALLFYKSDVHSRDKEGRDALLTAVGFEVSKFFNPHYPAGDLVRARLAAGADPNSAVKPYGQTAICEAVQNAYRKQSRHIAEGPQWRDCGGKSFRDRKYEETSGPIESSDFGTIEDCEKTSTMLQRASH